MQPILQISIERKRNEYEAVTSGTAYSWAEENRNEALKLLSVLGASRSVEKIDQSLRDLIKAPPTPQNKPHSPQLREVGFIGKQMLPFLRSLKEGEYPCKLVVACVADFRFIRLVNCDSKVQPPPLAYLGNWSHRPDYCDEVNLLALFFVLNNNRYRNDLAAWLQAKSVNLLDSPPLEHLRIKLPLKIAKISQDKIIIESVCDEASGYETHLPNLTWSKEESPRLVHALPSMLSIWHDATEREGGISGQLLIASPHLRNAVARGANIWRDKSIRSALLIAPPGSGKEVLADFLHAGRVVFRSRSAEEKVYKAPDIDGKDYTLPTIQFAGYEGAQDWVRALYGTLKEAGEGGHTAKDSKTDALNRKTDALNSKTDVLIDGLVWRSGLLRRARGTTVFFDEIDKTKASVLRALLRFLENDDVTPAEGVTFTLGKGEGENAGAFKCLRLFAGSKPRNEIFGIDPPDFWTRIQLVVDIVHPLEIHASKERLVCLQEYVLMFLYRGLAAVDCEGPKECSDAFKRILENINAGEVPNDDDFQRIQNRVKYREYPYLYLDAEYANLLSLHVGEFLVWIPPTKLSVRNLKALIKRLDVRIRDWVTLEFDPLDSGLFQEKYSDEILDRLETIQEFFKAMSDKDESSLREAIPSLEKITLSFEETILSLKRRARDRHRDRAWIWAHLHHLVLEIFDA